MLLRTTNQSLAVALSHRLSLGLGGVALLGLLNACSVVGGDQSPGKKQVEPEAPTTGAAPDPTTENPSSSGGGESGSTPEEATTGGGSGSEATAGDSSSTPEEGSSTPEDTTDDQDELHLQYMVITPGDQIVELDLQASKAIAYKVMGYYSDGETKDLSEKVEWSISSPAVGRFDKRNLMLKAQDKLFVQSAVVTAKLKSVQARAQLTLAAYEQDGANPDFLFILPHRDDAGDKRKPLKFTTKVQALDVFFNVDTTASMGEEMAQLANSLNTTIVPTLQKETPNTQLGVASVEDFPLDGFGHANYRTATGALRTDQPFRLYQSISPDIKAVEDAVSRLELGRGADVPEAILEGLYQLATGKGLTGPGPTSVPSNSSGIGGVGFRKGTMPIVVSITDAASHAPGETNDACGRDYSDAVKAVAATREQTEKALEKICARVITVASAGNLETKEECSPRVDGIRLANATDARVSPLVWNGKRPGGCAADECCTGLNGKGMAPDADGLCPLVFDVDKFGNGLDKSVVSGVQALAFFAPFDVVVEKEGEKKSLDNKSLPSGRTTLDFLRSVDALSFGALPLPGLPKPIPQGETFKQVTPGTEVTFSIAAYNDFVLPTTRAQVFRAKVGVKADQCDGLALDKRDVVFVVPPKPLVEG